eukprot:SAG25_NODE_6739_length_533_cov_1.654378_1_plen_23_part_01
MQPPSGENDDAEGRFQVTFCVDQ